MARVAAILLSAIALASPAAARPPSLADCDAASHATVLSKATRKETDARAYWTGAEFLKWPQQRVEVGRYRLYYAAGAQLRAAMGARVGGADSSIEVGVPDTLPAATDDDDVPYAPFVAAIDHETPPTPCDC